jgi:hypothetical protein
MSAKKKATSGNAAAEAPTEAVRARLARDPEREDEEEKTAQLEIALGEMAQGRAQRLAAWAGWPEETGAQMEHGAAWLLTELTASWAATRPEPTENATRSTEERARREKEAWEAATAPDEGRDEGEGGCDASEDEAGRPERQTVNASAGVPNMKFEQLVDGLRERALAIAGGARAQDPWIGEMGVEIEGAAEAMNEINRDGLFKPPSGRTVAHLLHLMQQADGKKKTSTDQEENEEPSAENALASRLARGLTLWTRADGGKGATFWETLAKTAAAQEGERESEPIFQAVAWLMLRAATRLTEMWLTLSPGGEGLAIELAGQALFGAGAPRENGPENVAKAAARMGRALADNGWTQEAWERESFEMFSRFDRPWWPQEREDGQETWIERAWSAMQARGGAWAKLWSRMCETRWEGLNGVGARTSEAPANVLGGLFAAGAWRWLEAVKPKESDMLDDWTPDYVRNGALTAGTAFWLCAKKTPTPGIDRTLREFERIYGHGQPAGEWWTDPVDGDNEEVDAWESKLFGIWRKRLQSAKPQEREQLISAWAMIARWHSLEGLGFGRWADLSVLWGAELGEDFVLRCANDAPDLWRELIVKTRWGAIASESNWPRLESGSLPVRASEYCAFYGHSDLVERIEREGGSPVREKWVSAIERWAAKGREDSPCHEQAARTRAVFERLEIHRVANPRVPQPPQAEAERSAVLSADSVLARRL